MSESIRKWSADEKRELMGRLQKEGRWYGDADLFRDGEVRRLKEVEGKRGVDAVNLAWGLIEERYPPIPVEEYPASKKAAEKAAKLAEKVEREAAAEEERASRGRISGLERVPKEWELADTAPVEVEVEWVRTNRPLVVSQTGSGGFKVDLKKARSPMPAWSTVSMLEFAIQNPTKFMELSLKRAGVDDRDDEEVVRERKSIEEIRSVLMKFCEAKGSRYMVERLLSAVRELGGDAELIAEAEAFLEA